jgi:hypothetical protein
METLRFEHVEKHDMTGRYLMDHPCGNNESQHLPDKSGGVVGETMRKSTIIN